MQESKKIKDLEDKVLYHKKMYYSGRAIVSDVEYDQLEEELRKLSPNSEVLALVGSHYFSGEKVEHSKKMLSLDKTYRLENLLKWKNEEAVVSTFKIDGSSCSLVYKSSKLVMAKTRGNGKLGENILNKAIYITSIAKDLKYIKNLENLEVRGEIYCTEENFIHLIEVMKERGLATPTSLRNIVAGLLSRKENIDLCKYLTFEAFELLVDDRKFDTEVEKLECLNSLGFITPTYSINHTKSDLEREINQAMNFIANGNYLIDGLVFTYNRVELHNELGSTAHHPRYKLAYKFEGEVKTTTIKAIHWQVSRNGVLTPVAEVNPVELSGAKVNRVTLHNYGIVKEFKIKEGDLIKIIRSGEVIPKFLEVIKGSDAEWTYPTKCPACKTELKVVDIRLYCMNENCLERKKDEILNFIKKIGIENISTKRLEEMIEKSMVRNIQDLYELRIEDLLKLSKTKEKLASKIIKSISNSKDVELSVFLSALGIKGGALNKCEKVVNSGYNTIEKILNLDEEKLTRVESFASKSAYEFLESLKSKHELIHALISRGINIVSTERKESSNISGLKFCVTGTLSMKRSELEEIIKKNNASLAGSVSRNTNYLITNEKSGGSSKLIKAIELNIPIINEEEFLNLI